MSSQCSFTCIYGIVFPLNPSATTVYARSAFYPNLRFTLSLQSAVYSLRFTLTAFLNGFLSDSVEITSCEYTKTIIHLRLS